MTWYAYRAQAALDRTGQPREEGAGAFYAIDDLTFTTPLTVRGIGGGAVLSSIPVRDFLTGQFEAEVEHGWWRSGSEPPVYLFSAHGLVDAARAAQAAAEAAAAGVALVGEATDAAIAGWADTPGSATRAAILAATTPQDTGWLPLPLMPGYEARSGTPRYRRIGKRVILGGLVGAESGSIPAASTFIIAEIPAGFRPSQDEWFVAGSAAGQAPSTVVALRSGAFQVRSGPVGVSYVGLGTVDYFTD